MGNGLTHYGRSRKIIRMSDLRAGPETVAAFFVEQMHGGTAENSLDRARTRFA